MALLECTGPSYYCGLHNLDVNGWDRDDSLAETKMLRIFSEMRPRSDIGVSRDHLETETTTPIHGEW